jgi:VCBS repeat-containing protein
LAALAALAVGCGGGLVLPSEGAAARIVIVSGDGQGAAVGAVLPESLVVRVTDSNDRPVQGQTVTFAVTAGGGSVAPASATTTADGVVGARWTLGSVAGPQTVTAAATGGGASGNVSVAFSATAGVASTSTGLSSSKNPSNAGETVQFTATVVWPSGAGTPTGTVAFRDGATAFATVPLGAGGTASASTAFTTAGQHSITAQYSGDPSFGGSTSPAIAQVVLGRPPVAANDAYTVNEDTPLSVAAPGVLGNDSDPDGNPITAVKVSDPAHGTVTLNANGSFTYTPAADYNGSDAFTYQASDGTLSSPAATVTITVNPVNDPPSFTAGPDQAAQAGAGPVTVTGWATNISPGPANASGQTVTFTVTNDTPGAFTPGQEPAVDPSGTLTFQPAPVVLVPMTATVTVTAHDNGGTANGGVDTSAPQQFTITITP